MKKILFSITVVLMIASCTNQKVDTADYDGPYELQPVSQSETDIPKLATVDPYIRTAADNTHTHISSEIPISELPADNSEVKTYDIKPGDTYWSIATRHLGDGKRWQEIERLNPALNRNDLAIGQLITLPDK